MLFEAYTDILQFHQEQFQVDSVLQVFYARPKQNIAICSVCTCVYVHNLITDHCDM